MPVPIKLSHSPVTEQISTNGVLSIWGFGVRLQIRNGQLCAEWGIGRDRHSICLPRVNRNLRRVVVIGSSGFATFDAIRWVSDIGASLIFLDRRGKTAIRIDAYCSKRCALAKGAKPCPRKRYCLKPF